MPDTVTPTARRAQPTPTPINSLISLFAATTIQPTSSASTGPTTVAKRQQRSLPDNGFTVKQHVIASSNIDRRHNAIVAKLGLPSKRPKHSSAASTSRPATTSPPPVSILPTPSTLSGVPAAVVKPLAREPPSAPVAPLSLPASFPVRKYRFFDYSFERSDGLIATGLLTAHRDISDKVWETPTRIPAPSCLWCLRRIHHCHARGTLQYCPAHPHSNGQTWNFGYGQAFGRDCPCHGAAPGPSLRHRVHPHFWLTTPAEEDVDELRPRRVRFAEEVRVQQVDRWYMEAYGAAHSSTDEDTIEDDEESMIEEPIAKEPMIVEEIKPIVAASDDFNSTWQAMMDDGFSDDED